MHNFGDVEISVDTSDKWVLKWFHVAKKIMIRVPDITRPTVFEVVDIS